MQPQPLLSHIVRSAILPPGCILIAFALAFLLRKRHAKSSLYLSLLSGISLYLLSIPPVSIILARLSEGQPPATLSQIESFKPEAIVVLGAGAEVAAPEYNGLTVPTRSSLKRAAYAAYLAQLEKIPIIASGGYGNSLEESEGYAIGQQLKAWGANDIWPETESRTTRENAVLSAKILKEKKISRILLVTSASHINRSKRAFTKQGLQVLAAPTDFERVSYYETGPMYAVPTSMAFNRSSQALQALFSDLWYWLTGS